MTEPNVGSTEALLRFAAGASLFIGGVLLIFYWRTMGSVLAGAAAWMVAPLVFKSAIERYCPIHDRLGFDTTGR